MTSHTNQDIVRPVVIKFTIREAAQRSGLAPRMLRYLERGIFKPERSQQGHRLYTEDDVARFKAINNLVAAGLSAQLSATIMHAIETGPRDREEYKALVEALTRRVVPIVLAREKLIEKWGSTYE